jgi:hypothetical protein
LFHARVHSQVITIAALGATGLAVAAAPEVKKVKDDDIIFAKRLAYEERLYKEKMANKGTSKLTIKNTVTIFQA